MARKRDWQKRKVYRFGWSLPHGKTYNNINDARQDLNRMFNQLVILLEIKNRRIATAPSLLTPAPQRKKVSIYSPTRHAIICAVGKLNQRKLIHELCHSLNKTWDGQYRRTVGASHGYRYTSIYIFALSLFLFDGDFEHVEQLAQQHGCKYDTDLLEALKYKASR